MYTDWLLYTRVEWFWKMKSYTFYVVPNFCRTPIPKFQFFMLPLSYNFEFYYWWLFFFMYKEGFCKFSHKNIHNLGPCDFWKWKLCRACVAKFANYSTLLYSVHWMLSLKIIMPKSSTASSLKDKKLQDRAVNRHFNLCVTVRSTHLSITLQKRLTKMSPEVSLIVPDLIISV